MCDQANEREYNNYSKNISTLFRIFIFRKANNVHSVRVSKIEIIRAYGRGREMEYYEGRRGEKGQGTKRGERDFR